MTVFVLKAQSRSRHANSGMTLWNRNPVQIPLCVATIVRVDIGGRTEGNQPPFDSTRAGQAADFFAGTKSARRNARQNLTSRQRKIEGLGRRIVRQQRSPGPPADLSIG